MVQSSTVQPGVVICLVRQGLVQLCVVWFVTSEFIIENFEQCSVVQQQPVQFSKVDLNSLDWVVIIIRTNHTTTTTTRCVITLVQYRQLGVI